MHWSRTQSALMVICICSAWRTILSTNVSMFDALSPINAIIYKESGRLSVSKMKDIYLSLDTQCAKSVPNSICEIFSSVLPKQLTEINKTFLCQKLECNAPSVADGPTWMRGVYQGNDKGLRVLDSCRGQRPSTRCWATLGQAHTRAWSL